MKRTLALVLTIILVATTFFACTSSRQSSLPTTPSVSINVITSYGSEDGNRETFNSLVHEYEKETGNKVIDKSGTSNEEWKNKINADFQTGAEPDVLMFYTGEGSDEIVRSQKLVSLDEIREEYPDYGNNMRSDAMPTSTVDGKQYAIPVNGYWEGLFVNKNVLLVCGILDMPDSSTTWEEFELMCDQIKAVGYVPIAVSLQEVPHYLFEYAVLNEGTQSTHTQLPLSSQDAIGKAWVNGLETIKQMYEKGYFPYNTLVASDTETFQMFTSDKAAFVIDGSWKINWFSSQVGKIGELLPGNVSNVNDFYVTYVPSKNTRQPTDIISGISMGYFITRRAWNVPEKRAACIEFVNKMTSDAAINALAGDAPTALIVNNKPKEKFASTLHKSAAEMYHQAKTYTPAVQDGLNITARNWLFGSISNVVSGKISIEEAIDKALSMPLGGTG